MSKNSLIKKLTAALFAAVLVIGLITNDTLEAVGSFAEYLTRQGTDEEEASVTPAAIEQNFSSSLWMHRQLIDLNGLMAGAMRMHGLYSDMDMYITDDRYIVSASPYTTTDYEVEETVSLRDFLEENGIRLLYVNEPTKYTDDSLFPEAFGIETWSNRNADRFLARIREAGVNAIDLRENMREDGLEPAALFYRTDHHWTVPAGLWAARIMADGLNQYCGYEMDLSVFDEKNFIRRDWTACWLGEQGKKMAETYVGLDDYTELKPEFATSYTFRNSDGRAWEGNFDAFISERLYNTENDVYENGSWHYAYHLLDSVNNTVEKGRILMLCDSYDHVTLPFLSLQAREIDYLILRDHDDSFRLRDHILEKGYDTVLIAYAQFMIGEHDDPLSANYRMFTFDH